MDDFKHKVPIQIRFNDIDMLGHVNNTVYFSYCDFARVKYFQEVTKELLSSKKINLVIASIKMDFCEPILLNEAISVQTKVTEIGNKSFGMLQIILDDRGVIKAKCQSVMVGYDGKNSIPISDELRSFFLSYETQL